MQTYIEPRLISDMTARILLETGAVPFNAERPFVFTSGWQVLSMWIAGGSFPFPPRDRC